MLYLSRKLVVVEDILDLLAKVVFFLGVATY